MEKPFLLHVFTPAPLASPFDINMAYDAGYNAVIPYGNVTLKDVANLTQDTIFSRSPKGVKRTGIFIGGRDTNLATDMLNAAKKAMIPPFEVSVFADPSGAFTTAAALVAIVEQQLKNVHDTDLVNKQIVIFGGTGPVGVTAAILAANAGAKVKIASYTGIQRAQEISANIKTRYNAETIAVEASNENQINDLLGSAEIIFSCAKAGVQVLSKKQLASAPNLLVVADVNAVPPAGIEGVGVADKGVLLDTPSKKSIGIGALAIGDIKYRVMQTLFQNMLQTEKPLFLDFRNAFDSARQLTA